MKEEQALKDILAVQKKKEKIVIRNDQLIVEKVEQAATEARPAPQKFGFLRRLAMGPVGIIFWSVLIALEINLLYRKVFLMGGAEPRKSE